MNRKFSAFVGLMFFFMRKIILFFLFCGSCPIFTSAMDNLHPLFLKEFINHHYFYSSSYNLIYCQETDTINLMKLFSESFQRFIRVWRVNEDFTSFAEEPQTFLLDLQCSRAAEILRQADDLHLLGKPFQWLLLTKMVDKNFSESKSIWSTLQPESLNILTDSDLKIAQRIGDEKVKVTSIYKVEKTLIEEALADWTVKEGLTILNGKVPAIRRWNLRGVKMSSSVVITRPNSLEHLEDLVDKHIDTTTKVSYNIVKLYSDLFNISITFKVDKEWGVFLNGSWTGMVGDLERHEIEIGAAPLFFRKDRMHILEYYAMVTPTGTKFIFLSPPLSYSRNIFLMPFDIIVWFSCLGMVSVSCFLLFVALKYEKEQLYSQRGKSQSQDTKISFSEILILNVGAICLQGTVAQTQKPAGRIITLFLYLAYMFLYISYSAAIVAILQSSDTSIQTLSDFLKSPLKAGAEDVAYSQHYFKIADDEVRKAIYLKKIAPKGEAPHFLPVEEGIEKVRRGFYGYHVELSVGYQMVQKTFTEEEKCALQELEVSYIGFSDPWLVMKKRSPYAELFKIGVKRCIERGFKSRFVRRFYTKKPICSSKSSRFVSVGIVDCYYAFMLLLTGIVLAVGIFIIEIGFGNYLKRRGKQNEIGGSVKISPHYVFMN